MRNRLPACASGLPRLGRNTKLPLKVRALQPLNAKRLRLRTYYKRTFAASIYRRLLRRI